MMFRLRFKIQSFAIIHTHSLSLIMSTLFGSTESTHIGVSLPPPCHLVYDVIPKPTLDIPPSVHIRQFPYPLFIHPTNQQDFGQSDVSELGIPSSIPDPSRSPRSVTSPPSITESHPPVGRIRQYNYHLSFLFHTNLTILSAR
jgi:hypothetical protein